MQRFIPENTQLDRANVEFILRPLGLIFRLYRALFLSQATNWAIFWQHEIACYLVAYQEITSIALTVATKRAM